MTKEEWWQAIVFVAERRELAENTVGWAVDIKLWAKLNELGMQFPPGTYMWAMHKQIAERGRARAIDVADAALIDLANYGRQMKWIPPHTLAFHIPLPHCVMHDAEDLSGPPVVKITHNQVWIDGE